MIVAGSAAILLPAWLPDRPSTPIEQGTVEMLQAILLAASAAVVLGASSHAKSYRPICYILGLGLIAALVGEIEDFVSGILGWNFPQNWLIGLILLVALIIAAKNRKITRRFFAELGYHAGAGLIAAALLISYVFNKVIGSQAFWEASLGPAFSPTVPQVCKSYLELLACYLIFVGSLGLSITMARRIEPN